jgi:DNA excision repair protein ERCC-2
MVDSDQATGEPHSSKRASDDYLDIDYLIKGLFPYEEPYENQRVAIRNAIETFRDNGYYELEGPCGTGKTLIGAVAALSVIRDPQTQYKRVLVITPVKQQQTAFENDIQAIKDAIIDEYGHARKAPVHFTPPTSLTIVGRVDLCPYVDSSAISPESVSHKCPSLINNTYDKAHQESFSAGGELFDGARSIVESAESRMVDAKHQRRLEERGVTHENIEDAQFEPEPINFDGADVCPYYAQKLVDDELSNRTINYSGQVLDANTLRQKATQLGTCPYSGMKDGIDSAEIVIGNYAHVFHRGTVEAVTKSIIDESTLLVVDESHMLVEKVRDYLSGSVTRSELDEAADEIDALHQAYSDMRAETRDKVEEKLSQYSTSLSGAKMLLRFLDELQSMIDRVTNAHLSDRASKGKIKANDSIPFRDPEEVQTDQFDLWLEHQDFSEEFYTDAQYTGKGIGGALKVLSNYSEYVDGKTVYAVEKVSQLITQKVYADDLDYFCELSLSARREKGSQWSYDDDRPYQESYSCSIKLQNCIPAYDLQRIFSQFGGGMLMSATLSPVEVYEQTVGIDQLEQPTASDVFDLNFPEENRGSYIVPLTSFTGGNRENSTKFNVVRKEYAEAITDVIDNAEGNTMICMPSYNEAAWIGDLVEDWLDKKVYVDQSSSNDETIEMKSRFEKEEAAVLTTSLRGTLTEGVDYSGDRLSNVIVCGVPLTNPYSNHSEAIKTAYAVRFGRENAFDYSFSVPALYKTRQAIGRVIRNSSDVGTRVLIDQRYTPGGRKSVSELLSKQERSEFVEVPKDTIGAVIKGFWSQP